MNTEILFDRYKGFNDKIVMAPMTGSRVIGT